MYVLPEDDWVGLCDDVGGTPFNAAFLGVGPHPDQAVIGEIPVTGHHLQKFVRIEADLGRNSFENELLSNLDYLF